MEPNMSLWFTLEYWKDLKICPYQILCIYLRTLVTPYESVFYVLKIFLYQEHLQRSSVQNHTYGPETIHGDSLQSIFKMDDTAPSGLKVMLHKESSCIVQQRDQCWEMKAKITPKIWKRFAISTNVKQTNVGIKETQQILRKCNQKFNTV